jgi:N6-adenosine-specific RNA methylase IME4
MKKYQIIYADPPWQQTKGGLRKVRPNQKITLDYLTIPINGVKYFLSLFDRDCCDEDRVLFLWTIDKFLWEAENLGKDLGYKLHARIIWDKENGVAPAFTIRYSHEYLLWFYKGKFLPIEKSMRGKFTTVIREKSTKHSKKPIKAYEFIEALYPNKNKVELFARNKRRDWDVWGNEVESDIDLSE